MPKRCSPWMSCLAIVVVVAFLAYLVYRPALHERYQECQVKQCVQRCTDAHGSAHRGEQALPDCLQECGYVEHFYDNVSMPDPEFLQILNQGRRDYVPTPPIEAFTEKKQPVKPPAKKKEVKKEAPVKKKKTVEGFEEEHDKASIQASKKAEYLTREKAHTFAGTYASLMAQNKKNQQ